MRGRVLRVQSNFRRARSSRIEPLPLPQFYLEKDREEEKKEVRSRKQMKKGNNLMK